MYIHIRMYGTTECRIAQDSVGHSNRDLATAETCRKRFKLQAFRSQLIRFIHIPPILLINSRYFSNKSYTVLYGCLLRPLRAYSEPMVAPKTPPRRPHISICVINNCGCSMIFKTHFCTPGGPIGGIWAALGRPKAPPEGPK